MRYSAYHSLSISN